MTSVAIEMVSELNGRIQDAAIRGWALEHLADESCPYPHGLTDDGHASMDRCPVLASYRRRDEDHRLAPPDRG